VLSIFLYLSEFQLLYVVAVVYGHSSAQQATQQNSTYIDDSAAAATAPAAFACLTAMSNSKQRTQ
jgi:hypothetical protein